MYKRQTKGSGVLAIGGGTIDVLGYRSDGTPLTSPFDGFDSLSPRHPYAIVGAETVKKALSCFCLLYTSPRTSSYRRTGT